MSKKIPMIGRTFGLITIERQEPTKIMPSGQPKYFVSGTCRCGTPVVCDAAALRRGIIVSCGCARRKSVLGQIFGRGTVIRDLGVINGRSYSLLRCTCGTEYTSPNRSLISGGVRSCGCLHRETSARLAYRHGGSRTQAYVSWHCMVHRCTDPNDIAFERYGGAGVTIHPEWLHSFTAFFEYMGECPKGMTIDRWPNKTGNYEPGNVRWATAKQQHRNMTTNKILTIRGITGPMVELCEHFGVNYARVKNRINHGWDSERAFFSPPRITSRTITTQKE